MASSGNWLTDTWSRIANGVNPIQAIFTPAPKASSSMGNNTYYSPAVDPNPPAVLGASSQQAPAAPAAPSTGSYYGDSGSAPAYDPNVDPNLVGQARNQVSPLIAQLHQLYGELNGQIDAYGRDKRGQLDEGYNTNLTNNTNAFNKAFNTTNGIFTARGAADSSYLGNAQQDNKNEYNAANTNSKQSYDDAIAQLGSIIAQNKAAVSQEPQYDLSAYNDVNSLVGLRNALDSHINSLNTQKTNLLTNGQLRQQLDTIAPGTSKLDQTLKARIDALAGSEAPSDAAFGLGQGFIDQSGLSKADRDKWTTYLSAILSGAGSPTKAA